MIEDKSKNLIDVCSILKLNKQTAPFEFTGFTGLNRELGVKPIDTKYERHNILYGLGNFLCKTNLDSGKNEFISDHKLDIISIEGNESGRFFVTADKKRVRVYDFEASNKEERIIWRARYGGWENYPYVHGAWISPIGKYVVVAIKYENEHMYTIQFWRWSLCNLKFDDEIKLPPNQGVIKSIRFGINLGEQEFFTITLSKNVIFMTWDTIEEKLSIYIESEKIVKYKFNESCYVFNTSYVASVTREGYLIVWCDTTDKEIQSVPSNKKNLLKTIKITTCSANDIKMVDEFLTVVDNNGQIQFFDTDLKLIFLCSSWKLPPIAKIYPLLNPRMFELAEDTISENKNPNLEILSKSNCPTDYTEDARIFVVRQFYLVSNKGNVYFCDVTKKEPTIILNRCPDSIINFTQYPNDSEVYLCDIMGNISLYNYNTRKYKSLLSTEAENKKIQKLATAAAFSSDGTSACVGFDNGSIQIINLMKTMAIKESSIMVSDTSIEKIVFSSRKMIYALADKKFNISIVNFKEGWEVIGKERFHCKQIIELIFVEIENCEFLLTFGKDRFCVKYDISETIENENLVIQQDTRIEQTAVITAAALVPSSIVKTNTKLNDFIIIIANDQYKIKLIEPNNLENLFTFQGPVYETPIKKILYMPAREMLNDPLLIFASNQNIGLGLVPIDGNPLKYSGALISSNIIKDFLPTSDKENIIVIGTDGDGIMHWNIKRSIILDRLASQESELESFFLYVPGKLNGIQHKEMQRIFLHIRILADGLNVVEDHNKINSMRLEDIPSFMRANGFFPTDFEVDNMLKEMARTKINVERITITFDDLVKLYVNHKPIIIYQESDILDALNYFTKDMLENENNTDKYSLMQLLEILTKSGDSVTVIEAKKYLVHLFRQMDPMHETKISQNINYEFNKMQKLFDLNEFCHEILESSADMETIFDIQ